MAKRKLYGAAAAAHARKVARRRSTALVRRPSAAAVRTRTRTRTIVVRRRRRASGGGGGGGGVVSGLKRRAPELVASALYAFATLAMTPTALKLRTYVGQIPTIGAIGTPASHGLLALLIASNTSGKIRRGMDLLSTAALHRAAANLGTTGFDFEAASQMAGDGDAAYLEGELDDDLSDVAGDDDDMGDLVDG